MARWDQWLKQHVGLLKALCALPSGQRLTLMLELRRVPPAELERELRRRLSGSAAAPSDALALRAGCRGDVPPSRRADHLRRRQFQPRTDYVQHRHLGLRADRGPAARPCAYPLYRIGVGRCRPANS